MAKRKIPLQMGTLLFVISGAAIGLFFGPVLALIMAALGYFIGELFLQILSDHAVGRYFENPGSSSFNEGESGLAAFCALGVYILSKSEPRPGSDELVQMRMAAAAEAVFDGNKTRGRSIASFAESFSRIALSRLPLLNPDLLCESLLSRRRNFGDLGLIASQLEKIAIGDAAVREARYIRSFLDSDYQPPIPDEETEDPWKLLGLAKGASSNEVKSAFRKLAMLFHPDNQAGLSEEKRAQTGEAFVKIRDAYRRICSEIAGTKK